MNDAHYDVVIAGGGLAGCAAAIHLASAGKEVLVLERDAMPRDKLCGEFLSTEVSELCRRLGVLDRLSTAGAREIRRLLATAPGGAEFEVQLPGVAMGVSRHTLDAALFNRAREAGAEMCELCTVRSIEGSLETGFRVSVNGERVRARAAVGAYGRRDTLDRRLRRSFMHETSDRVAFKAHFVGLDLQDCIELHAFPGGYCGLLTEDHGHVNACWIAHAKALKSAGGTPEGMISGCFQANHRLAERFARLEPVGEYKAASQLFFRKKSLFEGDVCMIGDAAGMIAPLCGDGMAMAMMSGELAAQMICRFLDGGDAASFRSEYSRAWNSHFTARMRIGRLLHAGFVHPGVVSVGLRIARHIPATARAVIRATRG